LDQIADGDLAKSIEQSHSWENIRSSAIEESPPAPPFHFSLWNRRVCYCVYKSLSLVPLLSQVE